jgi:pimeloyl-ACP methyl ester carboxylesterase
MYRDDHFSELTLGNPWHRSDMGSVVNAGAAAPVLPGSSGLQEEKVLASLQASVTDRHELTLSGSKVKAVPHLIVLQHGFLGNHYDMRYLENALAVELSDIHTHVLAICSSDECSELGINKMAENLVAELNEYVEENIPELIDTRTEGKVSFIGHSMGGLVVRRALEHRSLHYLRHRCHVYVSLATPHLGTQYSSSPLVSTGMWVLGQWGKSQSLKELALGDGALGDRTRGIVYKLSENNVLALFRRVILVVSPGDMYVPGYSASLRLTSSASTGPAQPTINDAVLLQMHRNILAQVTPSNLVRITLANNEGDDRGLNSYIGRSAHICYLENKTVASFLIKTLVPFFVCDQ